VPSHTSLGRLLHLKYATARSQEEEEDEWGGIEILEDAEAHYKVRGVDLTGFRRVGSTGFRRVGSTGFRRVGSTGFSGTHLHPKMRFGNLRLTTM
jgi:hypothetical protein